MRIFPSPQVPSGLGLKTTKQSLEVQHILSVGTVVTTARLGILHQPQPVNSFLRATSDLYHFPPRIEL